MRMFYTVLTKVNVNERANIQSSAFSKINFCVPNKYCLRNCGGPFGIVSHSSDGIRVYSP